MKRVARRPALAVALVVVVHALAAAAEQDESSQELVLRCLGHIRHGEISAVVPLFAPGSLSEDSGSKFAAATQVLGLADEIEIRLVSSESGLSADGAQVDTVAFHLRGPESALLAVGQVRVAGSEKQMIGLTFNPAPIDPSEMFPFVWTGLSYVHYYVLIALFCVPALIVYATVRCLRRESGLGWLWIPFILIGIGRVNAVWVPGPPDARLFTFLPGAITVLGVGMQKLQVSEPWIVSVSVPIGAIVYLWWVSRQAARPA